MALHNVYSKELSDAFRRGHPIANPQPVDYGDDDGEPLRPVEIGDVGYIQPALGYFVRLFNVHLEPGVPGQPEYDGLPDGVDFQPLRKHRIMFTKDTTPVFVSHSVATKSLTPSASGPFFGGFAEFSTSSDRGAILATPDPIECYNAIHILSYKEHFKDNIERWHEFALAEGHDIALEDLMLVTGVDRTTSWANAMFSESRLEAGFGLEVDFATVGAGLKLACRYSWQSTVGALVNSGPAPYRPAGQIASASGAVLDEASDRYPVNTTSNQSLFVRHIRAKRRRWRGMKIEARGEKDDDDDDDDDDDSGTEFGEGVDGRIAVASDPGKVKFTDCLEPVLDYILEHSDASIAVAHDEDLNLLHTMERDGCELPVVLRGATGMLQGSHIDDKLGHICDGCGDDSSEDATKSASCQTSDLPLLPASPHSPEMQTPLSPPLHTSAFESYTRSEHGEDRGKEREEECADSGLSPNVSKAYAPTSEGKHAHGNPREHDGPDACGLPLTMTSVNASSATVCSACGQIMAGEFVRALGTVFHLHCFTCMDCDGVVHERFFPVDTIDGQRPLCEHDYFLRLGLICASCGAALRGSYIVACEKKYHVEHFTCSICPTVFGPQDSYYEHDDDVFCHYHYSTRRATKCAGCDTAILEQFVEIQRNQQAECWHPECYLINKFWNVKVVNRKPKNLNSALLKGEARETAASLKENQIRTEQQVSRIWTVLSAFEESSAACIASMLRHVSNGQYLETVRVAEKFILHVEVLFATLDDIDFAFARLNLESPLHVREARILCRKTVDLFTLFSHTQEHGARRTGITQELLVSVTNLAHYLKILIRITLTSALKLEREHGQRDSVSSFLDKLHLFAVQGCNPSARRMMREEHHGAFVASTDQLALEALQRRQPCVNVGTMGVTYGFRSLAPEIAGDSPFSDAPGNPTPANAPVVNPPSDLCVRCGLTIEGDCIRLGPYQRWHSACVACKTCGKATAALPALRRPPADSTFPGDLPAMSSSRQSPADTHLFVHDSDTQSVNIFCIEHGDQTSTKGFVPVSRLEQYAFLLTVALRRLHWLLEKNRNIITNRPSVSSSHLWQSIASDRRDETTRMPPRLLHLDRKLSATARLPKRSTVVESRGLRWTQPIHAASLFRRAHSQSEVARIGAQRQQQLHQTAARVPLNEKDVDVTVIDHEATDPLADELTIARNSITLSDIPQMVQAAQVLEQQRVPLSHKASQLISELTPLELAIIKHAAVDVLYRSTLRDSFELGELLDMIGARQSGSRKMSSEGSGGSTERKVFGVPLELLVEKEGADSSHGAARETLRVPSLIDDVVSAMRLMYMSVEGIFRKNGNIKRLNDIVEVYDRDPDSVDLTSDNPVQLAALLKRFLRELPDPLLTFRLHKLLILSQDAQTIPNDAERKRLMHMLMLVLPKAHRDTLEVLSVFLKWVASFEHVDERTGYKLDLPNLATVICPSILYSQGRDAVRDDTFGAMRVVQVLLENQDEFHIVPAEFAGLLGDQACFAGRMEMPGKEFMKKVEAYMTLKATSGQ